MITITYDKDLKRYFATLSANLGNSARIRQGMARGLNAHLRLQERQAVTLMAAQTKLPEGRVGGVTRVRYSGGALEGRLTVRDASIPLGELTSRSHDRAAPGATAEDWNTKTYRGSFIVPRYGGRIFHRAGKARFPIVKNWGPLLPNELLREDMPTRPGIERLIESDLIPRVLRNVVNIVAPE